MVGVYYKSPIRKKLMRLYSDNGETINICRSWISWGLNCPDITWKGNTGSHRSWGAVDCIDENFVTQAMDDLMRGGTLLDRIPTKKAEVVKEEKTDGKIGCCDHEMVEFLILKGKNKANIVIKTQDYRTAEFGLLKDLLGRIPQEMVMEKRADQKSWFIFKDHLLQA